MTPSRIPIGERAAKGDYDLVIPLHMLILEMLPVEGTTFADLYELGSTSVEVSKNLPPGLKATTVAARIRALALQGLARKIKLLGGGGKNAWQATNTGKDLVNKWKGSNGNGSRTKTS